MKMLDVFKKYTQNIPKSKSGVLVVLGIIGLLLILVSSFGGFDKSKEEKDTTNDLNIEKTYNADTYTANLEKKLEAIISDMLGGTRVSVMITLESGAEYVYANETKVDAGVKKDQAALKTEQNDSNQNTYVVIKDADGNEQALVVTEKMPIVRGVVIVCDSGQTQAVSSAVKMAVKSALQVDEQKICIIGRY